MPGRARLSEWAKGARPDVGPVRAEYPSHARGERNRLEDREPEQPRRGVNQQHRAFAWPKRVTATQQEPRPGRNDEGDYAHDAAIECTNRERGADQARR